MTSPEAIVLDYSTFVTFYNPGLRSLASARKDQPPIQHSIQGKISDADATTIFGQPDEVLRRNPRSRAELCVRVDWAAKAR